MTAFARPSYTSSGFDPGDAFTFCMSFGVQYRNEPHPTLPSEVAEPDSVVEIVIDRNVIPDPTWAWSLAHRIAGELTVPQNFPGSPVADHMRGVPHYGFLHEGSVTEHTYFPGGVSARVIITTERER